MAAEYNVRSDETIVIGHRNPDTDSICSAICYAHLKKEITGGNFVPARAGSISSETSFVLDYFGVKEPMLLTNITTQVRDIEIRKTQGIDRNTSIKRAWQMMREHNVMTLPIIDEQKHLEGIITVSDIAHNLMDVFDNTIISKSKTSYANILDTLDGTMIVGNPDVVLEDGKVLVAAANPDMMESYIEKNDIVIVANRYESQLCAIEMDARCIIVCLGTPISKTIKKLAEENDCYIISTPHDVFTVANLINQSISVSYFMKTGDLTIFDDTDYIDEVSDIMKTKRYRYFPIIGSDGKYIGTISRRNLLGARGKKVILVDHNEKNQAVDGIEHAEIQEIIDHHRIGAVETVAPVFFRNQPLGCTATIIYQMYKEHGVPFTREIAGLMVSAILSDTLMFRSPTSTIIDQQAVEELAPIAGIDVMEYAEQLFAAAGDLANKTNDEIFFQDFKRFRANDIAFGVGQIVSINRNELTALQQRLAPYMEEMREKLGLDMIFFMLTDIMKETSLVMSCGENAVDTVSAAFSVGGSHPEVEENAVRLPGVMSRKKQLVPRIITALQGE